ncbi:unnamed protein product [Timema podura]|uniref:Uncharacterized protein n=1 Tax=Timema podura TaxID=61482 RepID=A0ABN7P4Z3_TIMPD|nr:unnamed protein product [Timema podura]
MCFFWFLEHEEDLVNSLLRGKLPGVGFPQCLLYCVCRNLGMVSSVTGLLSTHATLSAVGRLFSQEDRIDLADCIILEQGDILKAGFPSLGGVKHFRWRAVDQ